MKELYEKRISELERALVVGYSTLNAIKISKLKQWAIAIVKDLWKHRIINNEYLRYSKLKEAGIELRQVVQAEDTICWFLIDRFELTEKDLK